MKPAIALIGMLLVLFINSSPSKGEIIETNSFVTLNKPVPDGNAAGLSDVHSVSSSSIAELSRVRVTLRIVGEFNGDLYGYLRHITPATTNFCVLLNRPGKTSSSFFGYDDSGFDITFEHAAVNGDIHSYRTVTNLPSGSPLLGTWQPDGRRVDPMTVLDTTLRTTDLASFAGVPANGEWTLFLADMESGGTNFLVSWSLELFGPLDTDGDGIPDNFELANGLNPNNAADAALDADGDSFSNLQEFAAGTALRDSSSALRITSVEEAGSDVRVSFSTVAGKTYRIERNDNFPSGAWTEVASLNGTGSILNTLDLGANALTQAIYRVSCTNVVSTPAGFCKLALLGNSDTMVSFPFTRPEVAAGLVEDISDSELGILGAPAWTPNQFVYAAGIQTNTYYLLIRSGAREGRSYTITGNTANRLSLDLQGDTLSGLNVNDQVSIIPYWTLAMAFSTGAVFSASSLFSTHPTQVLMPDLSGTGINRSTTKTYFHHGGIWKQVGQGNANKNDDVLLPTAYVILRHNVGTNSVCNSLGQVITSKISIPLVVSATTRQDNFVALPRPPSVSLNDSGLTDNGAFAVSPSGFNPTDLLLVFDNTTINKNKSASSTYYYLSSGWRRIGTSSTTVGTNQIFAPDAAVIIRKAAGGVTPVWINSPAY